jgi:hypothetical protein
MINLSGVEVNIDYICNVYVSEKINGEHKSEHNLPAQRSFVLC